MSNAELADAIFKAHWYTQHTAHMMENYADLVKHLRALLAEQERRAKERNDG